MLEIKVDGDKRYVRCEGSTLDLLAEMLMTINAIYSQMHKANPMVGRVFRKTLVSTLADPDCPTWVPNAKGEGISIILPK